MTIELEAWHLISGLAVLAGWIYVQFIRPMQVKQQELDKRLALAEQRLESGDKKFQEVLDAISALRTELKADHKALDDRLRNLENALAKSVWRGVGED